MKKGNIQVQALVGIFWFMIAAFLIAVSLGVFVFLSNTMNEELLKVAPKIQGGLSNTTNMTEIVNDTFGQVPIAFEAFKWISVMLIIGYILNFLIIGYFSRIHPVLFIAYIFISITAIIVSAPLANAYEDFSADPNLASSFEGFFGMNFIFENFPVWVTAVSILGGIVIFIGIKRSQGNPGAMF